MRQWKKPKKLHRSLKQLGYKSPFKLIKMTSRHNSASPLASYAMPNKWFDELKLVNLEQVKVGLLFTQELKEQRVQVCRIRILGPYVRLCERDEAATPHPNRLYWYVLILRGHGWHTRRAWART